MRINCDHAEPGAALKTWLCSAAAALALLAAAAGCATDGTPAASPARAASAPARSTASQVYNLLYTLKTNAAAAAMQNALPEERVPGECEAFLYNLNQVSPGLLYRLEIDPFVHELFLVDPSQPGGCYGCPTNRYYLVNGGRFIGDANSEGVAWVLPIGPRAEKAVFILSNSSPQRTTIFLLDDSTHGRLLYDSYATPGPEGIAYLCGVEVVDRDHFFLHEGWMPMVRPGSIQAPEVGGDVAPPRSLAPRTFRLTVNDNLDVEIAQ